MLPYQRHGKDDASDCNGSYELFLNVGIGEQKLLYCQVGTPLYASQLLSFLINWVLNVA